MGNKTCFKCFNLSNCQILKKFEDENGRVNIQVLEAYADDCSKYFNPNE